VSEFFTTNLEIAFLMFCSRNGYLVLVQYSEHFKFTIDFEIEHTFEVCFTVYLFGA
jgi:hypothetical protein